MSKTVKTFSLFLLLTALLVGLDQFTKHYIVNNFALYSGVSFIKDFFSFYYVRNTGSAFSFLADKSWGIHVLTFVSCVLAGLVCYCLYKTSSKKDYLLSAALTLLLSGAIGNLIDRIRLKFVIDFIRFDFGSYTFPIFNVADICAVLGTIMLIAVILFLPARIEDLW